MNRWIFITIGLCVCACMDPLKNYDACIEIETARCDKRHSCRDNDVFKRRFDDFDKKSCLAYIKEHCRTREIQGEGWDDRDVEICARAIKEDIDCEQLDPGVDETQEYLAEACFFIEAEETDEQADTSTGTQPAGDTAGDTQSDLEATDSE